LNWHCLGFALLCFVLLCIAWLTLAHFGFALSLEFMLLCFVSLWLALSRYGLLCLAMACFVSLWLTLTSLYFTLFHFGSLLAALPLL